ncbi:TniQ family protein [Bacillus salipaludis]|uniref:TniQ family protein n=1 Tax=Bacillus salipaludis TaxID=2547811 RepID=A0ABW8R9I5_9BACI
MDNEIILLNTDIDFINISTLFNIEPIGDGTAYIESLTSYLIRLANAHCVSVGTLINNIIGPTLDKSYVVRSAVNGGNRFYDGAKSLNGIDKNSKDLVSTLETLTSRNDLEKLTFYSWRYVLTNRNLLKDHLEWCPECLESFKEVYGCYYFPLLWSVKSVNYCNIHEKRLVSNCPGCKKTIPILHRRSDNENCPFCGVKLKLASQDEENTISQFELFFVENVNKLIEFTKNLDYKLNREIMSIRFKFIEQSYETAYNNSLRKELKIPKSTYHYWISGKAVPTIDNLLKFCYLLGITIEGFFFNEHVQFSKRDIKIGFKSENTSERRKLNYEKISKELNSFMNIEHPFSMEEIAQRIKVPKRTLYRKFPDLCKRLSKRYMEEIKNRSLARRVHVESLIEKSVTELIEINLFPTQKRIEEHLSTNSLLREGYAKKYLIKCLKSI